MIDNYSGKRGRRPVCPICKKSCNALFLNPLSTRFRLRYYHSPEDYCCGKCEIKLRDYLDWYKGLGVS